MRLAPRPGARIAVVGAAGGIGRAVVALLHSAGCAVVALDLPASLEQVNADWPDDIARIALDATEESDVETAFGRVADGDDALDGLVHLAGFTRSRQPVAETPHEAWREVVCGNLDSAFLCAKAALPLLHRGHNASIVLTSSGLAVKSTPGYGPYSAAKAGILSLTRLLASENAPAVRVNAVAPAAVETPFLTGGTGRPQREAGFDREAYLKTVPLGRMAEPADVAGPIAYLLGPASSYITGQTVHVNGGLVMP